MILEQYYMLTAGGTYGKHSTEKLNHRKLKVTLYQSPIKIILKKRFLNTHPHMIQQEGNVYFSLIF